MIFLHFDEVRVRFYGHLDFVIIAAISTILDLRWLRLLDFYFILATISDGFICSGGENILMVRCLLLLCLSFTKLGEFLLRESSPKGFWQTIDVH